MRQRANIVLFVKRAILTPAMFARSAKWFIIAQALTKTLNIVKYVEGRKTMPPSNEPARTPGPWKYRYIRNGAVAIRADRDNDFLIAKTWNTPTELGKANAEFIVKAVNSHDELQDQNDRLRQHRNEIQTRRDELEGINIELVEALKGALTQDIDENTTRQIQQALKSAGEV